MNLKLDWLIVLENLRVGILVTDSQIPKEIRQGLRKTAVPTITVDV